MRVLVVGAGATGGYFGGRLAQAGRDVTFLVRPRRAEFLRAAGLRIAGPYGDVTLHPTLLTAGELHDHYDTIIVTVKAFSLAAALDDLAPAVGPDTMILPVLNGMRHIDTLIARFGMSAVVGCVCKIATTLDEKGGILQLSRQHDIAYGEMDGVVSSRIERLDKIMQGVGFDARLAPDIEREMWEKWIMLATVGAITCLMRGNLGEVARAPGGTKFVRALLDEVVTAISAVGRIPGQPFLDAMESMLTQQDSVVTSSMYRDLLAGLTIEAEQIIGDLLVRARERGIATPLLSTAHTHLAVYEGRFDHAT